MLVDECPRAQQPEFLAVGDQHDQVVAKLLPHPQHPQRLEDRDHSRAVVARAQRDLPAVVVRGDQHRPPAGFRSRDPCQHVPDGGRPRGTRARNDRSRCLDLGLMAEAAKLVHQVLANPRVGGRPGRPRFRGDPHQVCHRPPRREEGVRRGGRDWRGHRPIGTGKPGCQQKDNERQRATQAAPRRRRRMRLGLSRLTGREGAVRPHGSPGLPGCLSLALPLGLPRLPRLQPLLPGLAPRLRGPALAFGRAGFLLALGSTDLGRSPGRRVGGAIRAAGSAAGARRGGATRTGWRPFRRRTLAGFAPFARGNLVSDLALELLYLVFADPQLGKARDARELVLAHVGPLQRPVLPGSPQRVRGARNRAPSLPGALRVEE